MKVKLKDIEEGLYRAKVSQIVEETGPYGPFLRLIFTITEGELRNYRFSGSVRATSIRQSKFCRWVSNIFDQEPEEEFYLGDMIGKECLVCLSRRGKTYFVTDVYVKDGVLISSDE